MIDDKPPLEMILDVRVPSGLGGRWYGAFPALVTDIKDPDGQGRVKIALPWSADTAGRDATKPGHGWRRSWPATIAVVGSFPDVNDEVLVVFEGGDPRRPYVIGSLWNGTRSPPESMDGAGNNYKKVLRSRNGVKVTLDDHGWARTVDPGNAGRSEADVERRSGRGRNRRQQRQLDQTGN